MSIQARDVANSVVGGAVQTAEVTRFSTKFDRLQSPRVELEYGRTTRRSRFRYAWGLLVI